MGVSGTRSMTFDVNPYPPSRFPQESRLQPPFTNHPVPNRHRCPRRLSNLWHSPGIHGRCQTHSVDRGVLGVIKRSLSTILLCVNWKTCGSQPDQVADSDLIGRITVNMSAIAPHSTSGAWGALVGQKSQEVFV